MLFPLHVQVLHQSRHTTNYMGRPKKKQVEELRLNVYFAPEIILQLTLIQTNRTPVAPPARTTSSQRGPTGKQQQEPTKTTMSEEEIMAKAIALSMAEAEEKKKRCSVRVSDPGLLNRTAWTNAAVALDHIKKVNIVNTSFRAKTWCIYSNT